MRIRTFTFIVLVISAVTIDVPLQLAAPLQLGALAPANMSKSRPKAPFDLTGTWLHDNSSAPNSWKFIPPTFKLTPEAQKHYEAGQRAAKEGKLYRDDIGQCWPAGMPLIMTRVWPIAMNLSVDGKAARWSWIPGILQGITIGWTRVELRSLRVKSFVSSNVCGCSITVSPWKSNTR
jgi:hypothetical protein